MYQHPQALELNARYYRAEALRAAQQRRLANLSRSHNHAGSQRELASRARDVEHALILLTTLALALVVAAIVLL